MLRCYLLSDALIIIICATILLSAIKRTAVFQSIVLLNLRTQLYEFNHNKQGLIAACYII